jgi:hypothetical protein
MPTYGNEALDARLYELDGKNLGMTLATVSMPLTSEVISQVRFVCVRIQQRLSPSWTWDEMEPTTDQPRPMSNLLTPPGLVTSSAFVKALAKNPGAKLHPTTGPMPPHFGAWVDTDRGPHRLQGDETSRGLGTPKEWSVPPEHLTERLLGETTSVFHWEYLSASLLSMTTNQGQETKPSPLKTPPSLPGRSHENLPQDIPTTPVFKWVPPDL